MDFICSHSWCGRAEVERFEREYGDRIPLSYVIYPLIKDAAQFHDVKNNLTSLAQIGPHWAEVAEAFRQPIDHKLWAEDPVWSTWPAAAAFYAAEAQGQAAARSYFRALRRGAIAQRRNIARPEVLLQIASEAGLDTDRLARDLADPRHAERVQAGYDAAAAKGVRTRPTVIVSDDDGREYWVIGPRPWSDFEAAVRALTEEPPALGRGESIRVGGRVPHYDDLELVDQDVETGAVRSRIRVGRPRDRGGWLDAPPGPKRERWSVLRLLRVQGAEALATMDPARLREAQAAVLREFHGYATPVVSAVGRRAGRPFALLGVVGTDDDPALAESFARAGRGYLTRALAAHLPEVVSTPATRAETAWLAELLETGRPVCGMRHLPGVRAGGGLPGWYRAADDFERGDFCLLGIAEPLAPPELQSIFSWRAEDRDDLRARLGRLDEDPCLKALETALCSSLEVRERQLERLRPALREGAWYVWPALWVAGEGGDDGARMAALEAAFGDPATAFPLRAYPIAAADREHMRLHARAAVLCREQEITRGTFRHNTLLTAAEAAAFSHPI